MLHPTLQLPLCSRHHVAVAHYVAESQEGLIDDNDINCLQLVAPTAHEGKCRYGELLNVKGILIGQNSKISNLNFLLIDPHVT